MSKLSFPLRASTLAVAIAAALAAPSALANWPTDPSNNLMIAQHNTGSQSQPHMAATPDGGFYVSWIDWGDTASIRLQRLDADGNAQWGPTGMLVYHRQEGFTYDYGLDVDSSGNALLAFDQGYSYVDGTGTHYQPGGNILATKIAPNGTFVWGSGGVQVSPPEETEYRGAITGTSDGNAVVGWFNAGGQSVYQKLAAADGSPMWPAAVSFNGFIAGMHGADSGSAIVSIVNNGAFLAHKLGSPDGAELWGANGAVLSDGQSATGGLPPGYFPDFVPDGSGGGVFSWQVDGASSTTVRAQHVASGGARQFADNGGNGVDVSTNNSVDGTGTHNQDVTTLNSAAYDATTGDVYVLFEDWFPSANNLSATFAQRLNASGLRQWTDNGMPLELYQAFGQSIMVAAPLAGGVIATWSSSTGSSANPTNIVAQRIGADGGYDWSVTPVPIKTSAAETSRLSAATSTQGYAAFVWVDNDGSTLGDVRAQNLRYDGLLGKQSGAAPGAPTLISATDSGASNSDKITNDPAPQFSGSCHSDGDSIGLAIDGARAGTGTCSTGSYTITATTPVDGLHAVTAFEYTADAASPYSTASNFTEDTTAPAITLNAKPSNPASSGTATFDFSVDGPQTTQCQLDGGGFSSCTTPVSYMNLAVGPHTFDVKATDVAGNTGTTSYPWTIQPDPVTVNLDPSTDSGRSNSDGITNAQPLLFTGPCTDGDTIKIFAGAATLGTTTCSGGTYSVSTSVISTDGNKSISANATRGGLTGPTGTVLHITVDRHAPAAPEIVDPTTTVGPGPGAVVDGTAEINSIVTVYDGVDVLCTALTDGTGSWNCNASFNGSGVHALTATATDVAGNVSVTSPEFDVTANITDPIFKNGFDG